MLPWAGTLVLCLVTAALPGGERGQIEGCVLDGSIQGQPLPGIEVVLCVTAGGERTPVETATTDAQGRFAFRDLPLGDEFTYAPGANRGGIHYPGPAVHLNARTPQAQVKLLAYDTTSDECPLAVREHTVSVRAENSMLRVSEALVISNPSRKTYVGRSVNDMPPVTLRLSIPDDFEKVTFQKEFYGRQFMIVDGRLLTSLPWPPGERKLEFTYILPVAGRYRTLRRKLDLPTSQLTVQVPQETQCTCSSLTMRANAGNGDTVFTAGNAILPAGEVLELQFGELPVPLMAYAKWAALVVLAGLIAAATRWFRAGTPPRGAESTPAAPHFSDPKIARPRRMKHKTRTA